MHVSCVAVLLLFPIRLALAVVGNANETGRGDTWCELNAILPDMSGMAIFACQQSASMPPPQNEDCCPAAVWDKLRADPVPTYADRFVHQFFQHRGMIYNGLKKKLWDTMYPMQTQPACPNYDAGYVHEDMPPHHKACAAESCAADDSDLGSDSMYFIWHNNGSLPDPNMVPFVSLVTVSMYPPRDFMVGKLQPIAKSPEGKNYVLQSYKIFDDDTGAFTVTGGTAGPGEEENMCSYLTDSASMNDLPVGWTVSCGLLNETVFCGRRTCSNTLVVDTLFGTWCEADTEPMLGRVDVTVEGTRTPTTCTLSQEVIEAYFRNSEHELQNCLAEHAGGSTDPAVMCPCFEAMMSLIERANCAADPRVRARLQEPQNMEIARVCMAQAAGPTCGEARQAYKDSQCCGNPARSFVVPDNWHA